MMSAEETRASLLLRLRDSQDQLAWSTFLEIYQPLILCLTRRSGMQEAALKEFVKDAAELPSDQFLYHFYHQLPSEGQN